MDLRPLKSIETGIATAVLALVDREGSATHPYCAPVLNGDRRSFAHNLTNFADFIHLLVGLHGQVPGLIDHAAAHTAEPAARDWLLQAINAFTEERDYMHRLCVAAGPVPSTPGQSEASTIIAQQSHAIEMLAQSERRGCALGTAVTLVLEWQVIRQILGRADAVALLDGLPQPERLSRAIQFGADQLLVQHRGMWTLLKTRAAARQSAH